MEDENAKKSHSKMQLIIIEPNQDLEYYDVSKIGFHKVDDELCVVPTENKKEYFPITFQRNFVHQNIFQRIICIDECESDPKKYLLIFTTPEKCIRFIESIKNNKKVKDKLLISTSCDDETFRFKFLAPIVKIAKENSLLEQVLKSVLSEIHEFYLPFLKNDENISPEEIRIDARDNVNEFLNSVTQETSRKNDETILTETVETAGENYGETNKVRRSLRNKSQNSRYRNDECEALVKNRRNNNTPNSVGHETQHVQNENVTTEISNALDQNIGESNENTRSLRKRHANISYQMDENEDSGSEEHANQSEPSKKKQKSHDEIIYAPNFKYFHFLRMGDSRSRLFIFPTSDKKLCYEYFYCFHGQQYVCCGCNNKHQRTAATIGRNLNGQDYVKYERTDHVCDLRKYKPEKCKSDLLIQKPNWEIIKENTLVKGKYEIREFLLLFTSADKKKFFKLWWDDNQKMYICVKCWSAKNYIQAFVQEEIVYVRNQKHICSSMKYLDFVEASVMPKNENWEPPQRQWIKRYKPAKKISTMKKRQRKAKKTAIKSRKSKLTQTTLKTHIFKNQEDTQPSDLSVPPTPQNLDKSVVKKQSKQRSKPQHPKTPRNVQNIDESKIIRKPFYREFQRNVRGKMIRKLAIFNPNDSTMCYELTWLNRDQCYICNNCNYYCKKYVFARIIKNGSEDEFVQMGTAQHGCGYKKFIL